jgi:hypothetical protein
MATFKSFKHASGQPPLSAKPAFVSHKKPIVQMNDGPEKEQFT